MDVKDASSMFHLGRSVLQERDVIVGCCTVVARRKDDLGIDRDACQQPSSADCCVEHRHSGSADICRGGYGSSVAAHANTVVTAR